MIISSASLGKVDEEANLIIGCPSEPEMVGFMRKGEGSMEVIPTNLMESNVTHEMGVSNDYYFLSSFLFKDEQLQQMQLVGVPTVGSCMDNERDSENNLLQLTLEVREASNIRERDSAA